MKRTSLFLLLILLLSACSNSADKGMLDYEHSLSRADSLMRVGAADSVCAVGLMADLHRDYLRVKEESDGKRVRLMPADGVKRFLWGTFGVLMLGLNAWLSVSNFRLTKARKHRHYLVSLSENEQSLRNNERELGELEECLNEMSLTDDEFEEVHRALVNLLDHGRLLRKENDVLHTRLREYEKYPLPGELEQLKKQGDRLCTLDEQVRTLTSTLIDRDGVVEHLRCQPRFLTDDQWNHLQALANKVYNDFTRRLTAQFSLLTPADLQLCLLIRLHFTNAQVAALTAVSPASVSQQKFRLKRRLMQADEQAFQNNETVDMFLERY